MYFREFHEKLSNFPVFKFELLLKIFQNYYEILSTLTVNNGKVLLKKSVTTHKL